MLNAFNDVPRRARVCVALDCSLDESMAIASQLARKATWMKVGMTLYYAQGPSVVEKLKQQGFKVFLDLKLYDIPHQVYGAAAAAVRAGADMITVHASGGKEMMRKAVEGARQAAEEQGRRMPAVLGITVLTSFDADALASVGVTRDMDTQVVSLAHLAMDAGLDGVVASPHEAATLREALGPGAYIVTPGIRPEGAKHGDQSRVATPRAAFDAGSSHVVIGRPITRADNISAAWESICAEL